MLSLPKMWIGYVTAELCTTMTCGIRSESMYPLLLQLQLLDEVRARYRADEPGLRDADYHAGLGDPGAAVLYLDAHGSL